MFLCKHFQTSHLLGCWNCPITGSTSAAKQKNVFRLQMISGWWCWTIQCSHSCCVTGGELLCHECHPQELGQGHLWAPALIKVTNPQGSPSSCWLTDLHRQECCVPKVWLLRQRLGECGKWGKCGKCGKWGKCASGIPLQQLGNWSRWDAADGLRIKWFFFHWNHCKLVSCLWITEHRAAKLLLHWRELSLTWRRIMKS